MVNKTHIFLSFAGSLARLHYFSFEEKMNFKYLSFQNALQYTFNN